MVRAKSQPAYVHTRMHKDTLPQINNTATAKSMNMAPVKPWPTFPLNPILPPLSSVYSFFLPLTVIKMTPTITLTCLLLSQCSPCLFACACAFDMSSFFFSFYLGHYMVVVVVVVVYYFLLLSRMSCWDPPPTILLLMFMLSCHAHAQLSVSQ